MLGRVLTTAALLAMFAVIGTGLVAFTYSSTEHRIAENERESLLRSLHAIIPPQTHDNEIFTDTIQVLDPQLLGTKSPVTIYRARKQGQPVAAAFTSVAPDGYGGAIKLLVGVYFEGTVAGVRVVTHRETPGLGDPIEADRSDWIFAFNGKSLENPDEQGWNVRRDGGVFDQFTGATITPRAVVKAVHKTLIYFRTHRDEIFTLPDSTSESTTAQDTR